MKDLGTLGEFTCCYPAPRSTIGESPFDHTIDHVLGNKALKAKVLDAYVTGNDPDEITPSGAVAFGPRWSRQQAEAGRQVAPVEDAYARGRSFGAALFRWAAARRRGGGGEPGATGRRRRRRTPRPAGRWCPGGCRRASGRATPFWIAVSTAAHVRGRVRCVAEQVVEVGTDDAVGAGHRQRVAGAAVRLEQLLRVLLVGGDAGRGRACLALLRDRPERDPDREGREEECEEEKGAFGHRCPLPGAASGGPDTTQPGPRRAPSRAAPARPGPRGRRRTSAAGRIRRTAAAAGRRRGRARSGSCAARRRRPDR